MKKKFHLAAIFVFVLGLVMLLADSFLAKGSGSRLSGPLTASPIAGQNHFSISRPAAWGRMYSLFYGDPDSVLYEDDWPNALASMGEGRFVVAGSISAAYSSSEWYEGAVVAELDPQGEVLWDVLYPSDPKSPCRGAACDVVQTGTSCLAVGSYYNPSYDSNFPHALVMNLDRNGGVIWINTYSMGLGTPDLAWKVLKTRDGGYAVAGNTGNRQTGGGLWVFKLNASGDAIWSEVLVGSGSGGLGDFQETRDGGLVLVGTDFEHYSSYSFDNCEWDCARAWVIRLDSGGGLIWQKSYGIDSPCTCSVTSQTSAQSVAVTKDGGLAVEGFVSLPNGNWWIWVCKLSSSGSIKWQKFYNGGLGSCIIQTSDGGYLIGGGSNARAFKIGAAGGGQWGRTYSRVSENDMVKCVLEKPEGGYLMLLSSSEFHPSPDFAYMPWVVLSTDKNGDIKLLCRYVKAVAGNAQPGLVRIFSASFSLKYWMPVKHSLPYQAHSWPPVTIKRICGMDSYR